MPPALQNPDHPQRPTPGIPRLDPVTLGPHSISLRPYAASLSLRPVSLSPHAVSLRPHPVILSEAKESQCFAWPAATSAGTRPAEIPTPGDLRNLAPHDTSKSPRIATPRPQKRHKLRTAIYTGILLAIHPITRAQTTTSLQDLHQHFQNPPPAASPMMRWWWFGPAVTHDELSRELDQMHSVGIGGVEIQPVYPLALDNPAKGVSNLPYLSPAFLDAVTFANSRARSLGMRVDITLGSGWPYGGPHTTLADAAGRLKSIAIPITSTSVTIPQLEAGEALIAAFELSGNSQHLDSSTAKRLSLPPQAASVQVQPGPSKVALFFIASHTKQEVKRPAAGAEGLVLDHFSRAAIDAHLNQVATPLLSAFGTTPPESVFSDSLEVYGSDWTPNLLTEFQRRRGYDLTPHLPELLAGGTITADSVRHDWGLTLSELVNENYLSPINSFALEHHTNFRSQTYGEPAVTLANESTPALPEGEGPQWRSFSFTRWASSASHIYGRDVTSAETWTWLHSPAFRATPLDIKVEADRMFLQGVNQIVGHGWPYSPHSAQEPGWSLYAAAVFNTHNPWWPVMPSIISYLHRTSWLLQQGESANDIALLLPEDDAEAAFRPGHVAVTDEMKRLITPDLTSAILDAGYNLDYIDAATIDKLGLHHPVLILPPTTRIPLQTANKIRAFATHGGHVIAIGTLPTLAPGLREQADSAQIAALFTRLRSGPNPAITLVRSPSDLPSALHNALEPDLLLHTEHPVSTSDRSGGLGFIHRKLPSADIYFIANSTNEPVSATASFRPAHRLAQAWSPDTGALLQTYGAGPVALHLAPYESIVVVLTSEPTLPPDHTQTPDPTRTVPKARTTLDANWTVTFPGESAINLTGLGTWTTLPHQQFFSGSALYRHDFDLGEAAAPKRRVLLDFGPGTPTLDTRPPDAPGIHANLDPPIREAAIVSVNGQPAGTLWHPPYQLDISSLVHTGTNTLEVRVFNTAINELAGQPPRDYKALEARYGRRFVPQDMDHLLPIPSGLMGPISVIEEAWGTPGDQP